MMIGLLLKIALVWVLGSAAYHIGRGSPTMTPQRWWTWALVGLGLQWLVLVLSLRVDSPGTPIDPLATFIHSAGLIAVFVLFPALIYWVIGFTKRPKKLE